MKPSRPTATLIRHEEEAPSEPSTCGRRYRLISREDAETGVAAWAHVVEIDGAREHYHQRGTELYYVLEGQGTVRLDGIDHPVRKGSLVHIPPGVVHGAKGRVPCWLSASPISPPTICSSPMAGAPDASSRRSLRLSAITPPLMIERIAPFPGTSCPAA